MNFYPNYEGHEWIIQRLHCSSIEVEFLFFQTCKVRFQCKRKSYKELEQRIKELERGNLERNPTEEALRNIHEFLGKFKKNEKCKEGVCNE